MPLSRRYSPEWAPGESSSIGMDMSAVIPQGTGISAVTLAIATNAFPPVASTDFTVTGLASSGRAAHATMSGGVAGRDYQLTWGVSDTDGNTWSRTSLLLCAPTS